MTWVIYRHWEGGGGSMATSKRTLFLSPIWIFGPFWVLLTARFACRVRKKTRFEKQSGKQVEKSTHRLCENSVLEKLWALEVAEVADEVRVFLKFGSRGGILLEHCGHEVRQSKKFGQNRIPSRHQSQYGLSADVVLCQKVNHGCTWRVEERRKMLCKIRAPRRDGVIFVQFCVVPLSRTEICKNSKLANFRHTTRMTDGSVDVEVFTSVFRDTRGFSMLTSLYMQISGRSSVSTNERTIGVLIFKGDTCSAGTSALKRSSYLHVDEFTTHDNAETQAKTDQGLCTWVKPVAWPQSRKAELNFPQQLTYWYKGSTRLWNSLIIAQAKTLNPTNIFVLTHRPHLSYDSIV